MARVFVVDQNFLRSQELRALSSEAGLKFVLLDEALLEMCKAPEWENTMRHSLRALASRPGQTRVGRSMSEALRWELHHRQSVDGHLLHHEGTEFLQDILFGLHHGVVSGKLEVMKKTIEEAQQEMRKIHFAHESNKRDLLQLIQLIASTQPNLAEALRKNKLSRDERLSIIKAQGIQLTESFLKNRGFSFRESERMIRRRSLSLRFGLVRLWYAFDWLTRLGIEGIAPEKVSNEKIDYRYVTVATFFSGGLLTREVQMNRCFVDIAKLLRCWAVLS